ncbi:MAG: non-canonical purine NTP pyrophosphatase, partial [Patescibacteria group bacterium]
PQEVNFTLRRGRSFLELVSLKVNSLVCYTFFVKKLLIATWNQGKLKEISGFLSEISLNLVSLKDVGIDKDFEETESTYQENSQNKAIFYARLSGLPVIADDGGIEIDALDGEPGIHSKRWVGSDSTDEKIIDKMKQVSRNLPDDNRKAYFRTVVSLALPSGKVYSEAGEIEGEIAEKPLLKILKGYPYRSFFYLPKIGKYYHESDLSEEEEKLYNHRYKAIQRLKPIIRKELC